MGQTNNSSSTSSKDCSLIQNSQPDQSKDWVVIAKVGAPYGLKGWLKITSFTEDPFALLDYKKIAICDHTGHLQWLNDFQTKIHAGKYLIAKFLGIDDRNAAALLTNKEISVQYSDLPKLENDAWYWHDLVNLSVIGADSKRNYGNVSHLIDTGANDVLVLPDCTVPFILELSIQQVDLVNKVIVVNDDYVFFNNQ